jgi:hypothetical protein
MSETVAAPGLWTGATVSHASRLQSQTLAACSNLRSRRQARRLTAAPREWVCGQLVAVGSLSKAVCCFSNETRTTWCNPLKMLEPGLETPLLSRMLQAATAITTLPLVPLVPAASSKPPLHAALMLHAVVVRHQNRRADSGREAES